MTPYEVLRRSFDPLLPALQGEVRVALAREIPEGASLLDVGGRRSPYTIGLPASVTISDLPRVSEVQHLLNLGVTDAQISSLRRNRSNVADVVFDDMSQSALRTGSFDAAVSVEVIEHVEDDVGFVRNLARVVRPGGPVVLTTPNGDAKPIPTGDHRRHYRREQLVELLAPYFDVIDVRYAVAMTDHRQAGLRSFTVRHPAKTIESMIGNVRNRTESARPSTSLSPRGTAHLLAVLRTSAS